MQELYRELPETLIRKGVDSLIAVHALYYVVLNLNYVYKKAQKGQMTDHERILLHL